MKIALIISVAFNVILTVTPIYLWLTAESRKRRKERRYYEASAEEAERVAKLQAAYEVNRHQC